MSEIRLQTPLTGETVRALRAGDTVLLSGTIYTARDAAHKRMCELLDKGEALPFDMRDAVIYYVGPTPAKPGAVIGSAGPTTSYRMDDYAPALMDIGLRGMIGKGLRSAAVVDSMVKNGAVYFAAIGGAAALIAKSIVACELVAYEDLGSEAIRRLEVKDMPLTVVIDAQGNDLYRIGQQQYLDAMLNRV